MQSTTTISTRSENAYLYFSSFTSFDERKQKAKNLLRNKMTKNKYKFVETGLFLNEDFSTFHYSYNKTICTLNFKKDDQYQNNYSSPTLFKTNFTTKSKQGFGVRVRPKPTGHNGEFKVEVIKTD